MAAVKALCALKMQKTDGVAAEIIPNLFLGSIGCASSKKNLNAHGITHIMTVANKLQPAYPTEYAYHVIEIPDAPNANILAYFPQAIKFMEETLANPDNKLLVHCFAGKSRSSTVLLAYLMQAQGMNLRDAYDLVKSKREKVLPNMGFIV